MRNQIFMPFIDYYIWRIHFYKIIIYLPFLASWLQIKHLLTNVSCSLIFSTDRYGRVPLHSAAHWKLKELIRVLLAAKSYVNVVDKQGRTPLYVCVVSVSTGIYTEDLKYQVPCIKVNCVIFFTFVSKFEIVCYS